MTDDDAIAIVDDTEQQPVPPIDDHTPGHEDGPLPMSAGEAPPDPQGDAA